MGQLDERQYKATMAILFLISIAFTSAMIGTVAAYWKQRVDTCHQFGYEDCKDRTHDYLFKDYRNITNKFFVDCINLFFILISFGVVGIAYQKAPRFLKHSLVVIIFALSIWSLACSIKSIDEEDETNYYAFNGAYTDLISKIAAGEATLASGKVTIDGYKTQLAQVEAGIKQAQAAGQDATVLLGKQTLLKNGIAQGEAKLNAGKASLALAYDAKSGIEDLKEKYNNYRKSTMALILIQFVAIYAIVFINGFLTPTNGLQVESVKLDQVFTTTNEQLALKKNPSSQVEMNAQNAL